MFNGLLSILLFLFTLLPEPMQAIFEDSPERHWGSVHLTHGNTNNFSVADNSAFTLGTTEGLWCIVHKSSDVGGANDALIGHWNGVGDQRSWLMELTTDGNYSCRISTDGTSANQKIISSAGNFYETNAEFNLVCCDFKAATGTDFFIYVNGELSNSSDTDAASMHNSTSSVYVGVYGNGTTNGTDAADNLFHSAFLGSTGGLSAAAHRALWKSGLVGNPLRPYSHDNNEFDPTSQAGIFAAWKFEYPLHANTTTVRNLANPGTHNLTANSITAQSYTGISGHDFDGSNEFETFGTYSATQKDANQRFGGFVCFKPDTVDDVDQVVLGNRDGTNEGWELLIKATTDVLKFEMKDSQGTPNTFARAGTTAMVANKKYLAMWEKGTGLTQAAVKLYLNSTSQQSYTDTSGTLVSPITYAGNNMHIGAGSAGTRAFDGLIYQAQVFDLSTDLTAAEKQHIHNYGCNQLLFYIPGATSITRTFFAPLHRTDDVTGTADGVKNYDGEDGEGVNMERADSKSVTLEPYPNVFSSNQKSINFNGTNQSVSVTSHADFNADAITLIYETDDNAQTVNAHYSRYSGAFNQAFYFGQSDSEAGKFRIIVSADGSSSNSLEWKSASAVFDSSFKRIVVVIDTSLPNQTPSNDSDDKVKVWANGSRLTLSSVSSTGTVDGIFNSTTNVCLGGFSDATCSGNDMSANADNYAFISTAISENQAAYISGVRRFAPLNSVGSQWPQSVIDSIVGWWCFEGQTPLNCANPGTHNGTGNSAPTYSTTVMRP